VAEGMVFVAMKLVPDADTADIAPIVVSWAGDQPMIPLRLTAVAAEPEMGVTTWILSDRRYHSANFADIEPDWGQIRVDWDRAWQGGGGTNYLQLVARWADQHDGQAFITEYAQPTAPLLERFENQFVPEDDEEAQEANRRMIQILRRHSYLTRLYTRLSPEEMGADPVFQPGPAEGGNVENFIDLPEAVIGDGCGGPGEGDLAADACDFVACGAGGACFLDGEGAPGCACLDGAVARTVMEGGRDATTCQDRRLSFPDAPDVPAFGAVCAEFDCGEGGQCVNMNGTPTCECDRGLIAVGRFQPVDDGAPLRFTRCVSPAAAVPEEFYERTLGDLPIDLPPAEGEGEVVPPAEGEGEIPPPNGGDGGGSGGTPRKGPSDDGLCSVGPGSSSAALAPLLLVGLCVLGRRRRR